MTEPYWSDATCSLHLGDCLDVLAAMEPASVDAVVTDPPYGLEFMGKSWDSFKQAPTGGAGISDVSIAGTGFKQLPNYRGQPNPTCRNCSGMKRGQDRPGFTRCRCSAPDFPNISLKQMKAFQAWCEQWAAECLRVLKPGGHLLAFGGTRTWHRLACGIEDAGFEIRDSVADLTGREGPGLLWLYGSGFPKSRDVSKAIDAEAGATREVVGVHRRHGGGSETSGSMSGPLGTASELPQTAPATEDAARWSGWGTALKPAFEPVIVARKPKAQSDILDEIGSHLDRLETECGQLASDAAPSSAPTRAGSPAAKAASAPANAATRPGDGPGKPTPTGGAAGSSAATATSPSASAAATFLSTVTSWRQCWAELCEPMSTSTTATMTGLTTGLRTLLFSLSKLTAGSMAASSSPAAGLSSLAGAADSLFAAAVLNSRATLALSAAGTATGGTPQNSPDGDAPTRRTAWEPIVVARKPLAGTVAANVTEHGTGALNVDGCRVDGGSRPARSNEASASGLTGTGGAATYGSYAVRGSVAVGETTAGRWPPNVMLGPDAAAELDRQSGVLESSLRGKAYSTPATNQVYSDLGRSPANPGNTYGDTGGASRFFPVFKYEPKAPASERPRGEDGTAHPTVKPVDLMAWLVRLVTPPGGLVADPFAGSGATAEACIVEGFRCVLIEKDPAYAALIRKRLRKDIQPAMFGS